MGEHIRMEARPHDGRPGSLGELIHAAVRRAIEVAVDEELTAALGAPRVRARREPVRLSQRDQAADADGADRPAGAHGAPGHGCSRRTGPREWRSALLPRYQRRLREVNEAVVATYLAGGNTRRLRGALGPLLKAAPLSKSAVSRIVGTLKAELEAWRTRSLAALDVVGLLPRCPGPAGAQCREGRERPGPGRRRGPHRRPEAARGPGALPGGETFEAWKGCLDDLGARGLAAPVWCVIDGHPGLRKAVGLGVAPGAGPAVLRPQAAEPRAQGAEARARRDPGRLPPDRLRRERRGGPRAPTRPSSGSGRRAARAWSAASRRAARSCSPSSSSRSASGRRCGPPT